MNIKDLKYLVALADYGHFGKAANACFVSQPGLSMQIKKLEESLGIALIERNNKSFILTEYGAIIVERARFVLSQIGEMREIAKSAQDPFYGEIRIGLFSTLAPYLLPCIIPELSKMYPKLTIFLIEGKTADLIEQLKQGKLDVAILAAPVVETNFSNELLFEEEFYLAVPKKHALAKLKLVKQKNLSDKNLLLLEDGHCLRDQALAVCYQMEVSETHNFRATSLETLRHMISAGVGMTLMPKLACQKSDTITYIPFADPKPKRTIGMYWRANNTKKTLINDFHKKIKSILAKSKIVNILAS